jgi:hypothetical protein
VGKSFAYLVPAILAATAERKHKHDGSKKPIVISKAVLASAVCFARARQMRFVHLGRPETARCASQRSRSATQAAAGK